MITASEKHEALYNKFYDLVNDCKGTHIKRLPFEVGQFPSYSENVENVPYDIVFNFIEESWEEIEKIEEDESTLIYDIMHEENLKHDNKSICFDNIFKSLEKVMFISNELKELIEDIEYDVYYWMTDIVDELEEVLK